MVGAGADPKASRRVPEAFPGRRIRDDFDPDVPDRPDRFRHRLVIESKNEIVVKSFIKKNIYTS